MSTIIALLQSNVHHIKGNHAESIEKETIRCHFQRRFYSLEPHVLLKKCASSIRLLHFEAMLTSSTFAYLWDHVVSGMAIMPGAAMLEASLAAHFSILTNTSQDHKYTGTNVVSASILLPLALPNLSSRGNVNFSIEVDTTTGKLAEKTKTSNLNDPSQKHFECYINRPYAPYTLHGPLAADKRSMLVSLVDTSKEARPNTALAAIKKAFVHQFEHYYIHPTYLDTCTQAGSALVDMPAKDSSYVTRVPIGVQACQLLSRLCNPHAWACASIIGLLPDDSALGDFDLANCENVKRSLNILGMMFKRKRKNAGVLGNKVSHHGIYEQIWSVLQPQRPKQIRLPQAKGMAWENRDSCSTLQERFMAHPPISWIVATSLQFLQSEKLGSHVCLVDTSYGSPIAQQTSPTRSSFASNMQGAAAAGLIRVAQREFRNTRWMHITQSLYNAYNASFDPAVQQATDLSFHIREALWHVPSLCASFETNNNCKHGKHAGMVCNHSTIITGGLGGIGSLVGAWCAGGGAHAPVILMSRSSQSKALGPIKGMKESLGIVCFARCDVAMKDDVAALLENHAFGHQATKLVMHAGGTTADKTIQKQVCMLLGLNMSKRKASLLFENSVC